MFQALVAFICALPDIGNRLAADGSEGSAAIAGAVAFFLWTALGIASAPSAIYVAKEFLCNRNVATGLAWGLPVFAEIAVGTYIGPVGLIAHFFYQHKKCKNLEENAKVIEARADAIQSELENA